MACISGPGVPQAGGLARISHSATASTSTHLKPIYNHIMTYIYSVYGPNFKVVGLVHCRWRMANHWYPHFATHCSRHLAKIGVVRAHAIIGFPPSFAITKSNRPRMLAYKWSIIPCGKWASCSSTLALKSAKFLYPIASDLARLTPPNSQ